MRMLGMGRMLLGAGLALGLVAGCGRGDAVEEGSGEVTSQDAERDAGAASTGDEAQALDEAGSTEAEGAGDAGASESDAADPAGEGALDEATEAGRIAFEPGSEGGIVSGELERGGDVDRYVLRALAGQRMRLRLRGVSNGSIDMAVTSGEVGLVASNADAVAAELNELDLDLPRTGDYVIALTAAAGAPRLGYELEIRVTGEAIEPATGAESPAASDATDGGANMRPISVVFEAGAESAGVEGRLSRGDIVTYVLRAAAGQQLVVAVESEPAGTVDVMVFDPQSRPMRATRGSDGPTFELREDGEYSVTASNAATEGEVAYRIEFGITGAAADGDGAEDADAGESETDAAVDTRLFFSPGERSITVEGSLSAGEEDRYRLAAAADQRLALSLAAENPDLFQVYVEDAAGQVLGSGLEAGALSVELTEQQDYVVVILARPSAPESLYTLDIRID